MSDIICMGEVLIDFTPNGVSEGGAPLFARNPGGAPANVAVQCTRLGVDTEFFGKVGNDMFGLFLKDCLKENGVGTDNLLLDDTAKTSLAFVALSETGDRDFSFYRNPGSDTQITKEEINKEALKNAKLFCYGSLLLTNEPSKSAVQFAVNFAKENNVITAYDPNWRPPLWESEEKGVAEMKSLISKSDIIKVSDEEIVLITGCESIEDGAKALLSQGIKIVICTMGPKGCEVFTKDYSVKKATYDVKVVDTTGSGDSFFGTFLSKLVLSGKGIDELSKEDVEDFADCANAAGSACATKKGAIPALVNMSEIEAVRAEVSLVES